MSETPLSERFERTQTVPVMLELRPNEASAFGADTKACTVAWRPIRSIEPSMFSFGVGVVPTGKNVL